MLRLWSGTNRGGDPRYEMARRYSRRGQMQRVSWRRLQSEKVQAIDRTAKSFRNLFSRCPLRSLVSIALPASGPNGFAPKADRTQAGRRKPLNSRIVGKPSLTRIMEGLPVIRPELGQLLILASQTVGKCFGRLGCNRKAQTEAIELRPNLPKLFRFQFVRSAIIG